MQFPMIDWVSCVVPCNHTTPIHGDRIMRVTPEGERVWETLTAKTVEGSYSDRITIKTHEVDHEGNPCALYVSGNPVKWFQGHNVFGHNCPHELTVGLLNRLCELLPELTPTDYQRKFWAMGAFRFTRLDITSMFALGSNAAVNDWLRSAEFSSRTRHGRPAMKGNTLYWGKTSRRWSLKAYAKAQELEAHPPTRTLPNSLTDWAQDKLRVELVMRQLQLKEHGLDLAANWSSGDTAAADLYLEYLGKLQMVDNMRVDHDKVMTELPPRLAGTYTLWREGYDLMAHMSRPTFYRHRKELLAHGVDITHKAPPREKSNVVPLLRVVEAVPADFPEWAYGTDYLYTPPRLVV